MRRLQGTLALLLLVLTGLAAGAPEAAEQPSAEQPALISADEITYDQKLDVVVAKGHVEIEQAGRILLADTVTYNQRENTVIASGNVSLTEPSGEVIFADYAELRDDLKEGFVRGIRVLLTDDSRLAAGGARRSGGNITRMTKAVYSPCKPCEDHPEEALLWQLKAAEVTHDQEAKEIRYQHARLEMWGVPVAYTPYFEHPDPTVKRKSGLLVPDFSVDNNVGFKAVLPYYWVISKDKDVTFIPIYTTIQGPVGAFEYRQRMNFGEFTMAGSVTVADREEIGDLRRENRLRGHIFGHGRFDINDTWRTGFDVQRATDRTYLRRYGLSDRQTLTNNVFLEGFRQRDYTAVNLYQFQGLADDDVSARAPEVLPVVEYQHVGQPTSFGGRWQVDANLFNLRRKQGSDSRRLSTKLGWHLPYTSPFGDRYRLSATLQSDAYHVSEVPDPTGQGEQSGFTGRLFPQLGAEWSYPLVRHGSSFQNYIEPMAAVFIAPNGKNDSMIPNEDSQDLEFDDTNLFSANRFTGIDRVEGGVRGVYGARFGVYHDSGGFASAFLGQSLRRRADDLFPVGSGLEGHSSDYVGRLEIAPHSWFDLVNRFRLDKGDLGVRRNEVTMSAGPGVFNVSANYIFIDAINTSEIDTEAFGEREELSGGLSTTLGTDYWTFSGNMRRDLRSQGGWLNYGAGLVYQDECFRLDLSWNRSFTRDREVEAGDAFFGRLTFKHLGEVKAGL
ncbi:MAG: LPS-assembly protein LptD [Kiloniellales bacterium]